MGSTSSARRLAVFSKGVEAGTETVVRRHQASLGLIAQVAAFPSLVCQPAPFTFVFFVVTHSIVSQMKCRVMYLRCR